MARTRKGQTRPKREDAGVLGQSSAHVEALVDYLASIRSIPFLNAVIGKSPSESGAGKRGSSSRWAQRAMCTTTPCGRELLRDPRVRTACPAALPDRSRCAEGSLRLHRRLLQHSANPLGPRLPGTRELRGDQPCRLKRTCGAGATNGPRPLPPPWEGTTELISDTINHRNQPSVKAGQVHT